VAKTKPGSHSLPPQVAEAVRGVIAPAVEAHGLYLEDVKLTSDGGRAVVRVILDLPEDELGSLGSERLDEAAQAVSKALDDDDVVPGAYVLEVSTPGVSRPLTTPRHFKRARGRMVELNRKSGAPLRGRLVDVIGPDSTAESAAEVYTLVLDNGTRVPLADVSKGKVKVEMKKLADSQLGEERTDGQLGGSDGN